MSPTLDAFLRSWPFDPWLLAALLLTAGVYLRGWLVLRRRDPRRWHGGRLAAFLGGLAAIYLALASPIEPFAGLLLQVHMVQHLLLMMVAPPLLWLGAPLFPMLRGLPRPVRTVLGRPMAVRAAAAPVLRPADAPADGARPLRRRHLGLARPARLRPGPALERLALPPARVLPGHGPPLLVSRRPALPGPAALVALAAASRT